MRIKGVNAVKVLQTSLPGVLIIDPAVFGDSRGFFMECFNARAFNEAVGKTVSFVQDNHSFSSRNVLRGLHYQIQHPQGKLVRVTSGAVFDVAVDMRRSSSTFGQWVGVDLSAENKRMLWVPEGFAHGFVVRSETVDFLYKTTDYYAPEHERCLMWNDATVNVDWGLCGATPVLSEKDKKGLSFSEVEAFA